VIRRNPAAPNMAKIVPCCFWRVQFGKRNVFRAFGTVGPNREFNASGVHLSTADVAGHDHLTSQWSEGGWTVFIDEERQLFDAIRYVERRAMKEVLPRQSWDFVRLNVG